MLEQITKDFPTTMLRFCQYNLKMAIPRECFMAYHLISKCIFENGNVLKIQCVLTCLLNNFNFCIEDILHVLHDLYKRID